jgi:hypothetical protein
MSGSPKIVTSTVKLRRSTRRGSTEPDRCLKVSCKSKLPLTNEFTRLDALLILLLFSPSPKTRMERPAVTPKFGAPRELLDANGLMVKEIHVRVFLCRWKWGSRRGITLQFV